MTIKNIISNVSNRPTKNNTLNVLNRPLCPNKAANITFADAMEGNFCDEITFGTCTLTL